MEVGRKRSSVVREERSRRIFMQNTLLLGCGICRLSTWQKVSREGHHHRRTQNQLGFSHHPQEGNWARRGVRGRYLELRTFPREKRTPKVQGPKNENFLSPLARLEARFAGVCRNVEIGRPGSGRRSALEKNVHASGGRTSRKI